MSWTSNFLEPRSGRSPRRRRNFDDPLDQAIAGQAGPSGPIDTPNPLAAPVGPGEVNRPHDVAKVNDHLAAAGHFDPSSADGGSERFGKPSEIAVRRFQRFAGLNIDGLIFPDGPTIDALTRPDLGLPGFTGPARDLRRAIRRSTGKNAAENDRTVEALTKVSDPGPLPMYMAEAWNAGMDGKVDVADLLARLVARAPEAATTLLSRLVPMVPAADRGLLHGAATLRRLADEDEEEPEDPKPEPDPDNPKPPADDDDPPDDDDDEDPPDDDDDEDPPDDDDEEEPPDDDDDDDDDDDKPKPDPEKEKKCADLLGKLSAAVDLRHALNDELVQLTDEQDEIKQRIAEKERELSEAQREGTEEVVDAANPIFAPRPFIIGMAIAAHRARERERALREELSKLRAEFKRLVERFNWVLGRLQETTAQINALSEEMDSLGCGEPGG